MKRNLYSIFTVIILVTIAFGIGRCSSPEPEHLHDSVKATSAESEIWTCSMHPQIQQNGPGSCPICGMDLIPLDDSDTGAAPASLSMSESARALAAIETTVIERAFPEAEIRLVGTLAYDQTRIRSLTARFPARIERLFVNFTGVPVNKGDHLAKVYSPDLLIAQSELLTAHRFDPTSSNTKAAREKLRLWGLLPDQIDAIIASGTASDSFEVRAPISGIVVSKNVNEGDYLQTGQVLYTIVDLSTLWLELEAFESDLSWLKIGQTVDFSVQAYPGQTFQGHLTFIEPEIDLKSRTVAVRINVSNDSGQLKPGMFARATVIAKIASKNTVFAPQYAGKWISPMHPEIVKDEAGQCDICGMDLVPAESLGYVQSEEAQAPIIVPASAVLRTGKRSLVYLAETDGDSTTYTGRTIELGPRAGDFFVVGSGLSEGDRVVTNGAFKIDSALQIKAQPSMMNPSPSTAEKQPGEHEHKEMSVELATAQKALPHYFELQEALASDDFEKTKTVLANLMNTIGHDGEFSHLVHDMIAAESIDAIRRPYFEMLSLALENAIIQNPGAFSQSIYRMHCPMVYPDRGANWLQSNPLLQNPYFGSMMLSCGENQGELN